MVTYRERYNETMKKKKIDIIDSADEAIELMENIVHGWEEDPVFTDSDMNNLRTLIRKIWEDGYSLGRKDAEKLASEAKFFNY